MITCPKCSKELEDGAKFCDACGAQIFETIFCPNCGEKTSTEFAFCQKCGASVAEDAAPPAGPAPTEKKNVLQSLSPKTMMFGGIGIAALIVVILLVSIFSGGKSKGKGNYGLYLKDGEIVYADHSKGSTLEITSRLMNGESVSGSDLPYAASALGSYIAFSDNGSRIFFPDRIDDNADGITLYYRDLNKPNEESVKVDSDVTSYAINRDGTQVAYIKGSDGTLYLNNLTDKEKIARGVVSFHVTDDLKKIGYWNEEDSYYIWYAGKDTVKLASDISDIEHVSEDLSVIYYSKDGSLYKWAEGSQDKEKIASDVSRVISIYDSGEVYYTTAETAEIDLLRYVDDDMAASDAGLTEPVYPNYPAYPSYPSWWYYDTDEEYQAAIAQYEIDYAACQATRDQLREEYETAYDAYWAKRSRDSLRAELQNETMENTEYALYYFDGTESTIVTDALVSQWGVTCAYDKPVMVLQVYNQSEVQKVKLSEISYAYEVSSLVNTALYSSSERYIAVGSTLSILEQESANTFVISSDGSKIYFLDDVSGNSEGDLYQVAITGGQVGKPELYDSDVSDEALFFIANDKLAYYKNVAYGENRGDLFINGEEIDYDVRLWSAVDLDGATLYYTDWNSQKSYGTLKMSKNGDKTKIADDVHAFDITGDNNIRYLYDYSPNYYTGTLYLYSKGEAKKIDDDVAALIPAYTAYNTSIRGASYYGW